MKPGEVINRKVELAEWETAYLPDLYLTAADKKLLETLANIGRGGNGVVIEEVNRGVRIQTTSLVGVVQLENFSVHIQPKLAGGNACLLDMLEIVSGISGLKRQTSARTIQPEGRNLFDLIAYLLAEACAEVMKAGLLFDYLEREDTLGVLRGRLLVDRQMTRHFGQVDRLECRFDEYESNTPDNQLLALALKLADHQVKDPAVKTKVRRQLGYFQEICDPTELDWRLFRANVSYNRLNEHYRAAHELAWLVLDSFGFQDILKLGRTDCFSFLLDMNLLFEQFIGKYLDIICSRHALKLKSQARTRSIIWSGQKSYRDVIPDYLIEPVSQPSLTGVLPVDAKYKLYQDKKVSNDDIYQTFLYAFAFNWQVEATTVRQALLIYPVARKNPGIENIEVRSVSGNSLGIIRVIGVYLPDLIAELKSGKLLDQSNLIYAQIQAALLKI